jgi:hypothetical protein
MICNVCDTCGRLFPADPSAPSASTCASCGGPPSAFTCSKCGAPSWPATLFATFSDEAAARSLCLSCYRGHQRARLLYLVTLADAVPARSRFSALVSASIKAVRRDLLW